MLRDSKVMDQAQQEGSEYVAPYMSDDVLGRIKANAHKPREETTSMSREVMPREMEINLLREKARQRLDEIETMRWRMTEALASKTPTRRKVEPAKKTTDAGRHLQEGARILQQTRLKIENEVLQAAFGKGALQENARLREENEGLRRMLAQLSVAPPYLDDDIQL